MSRLARVLSVSVVILSGNWMRKVGVRLELGIHLSGTVDRDRGTQKESTRAKARRLHTPRAYSCSI